MNLLRHLPNGITLANLLCGCLGIVMVFKQDLETASYLILLAALFDFLDGFFAKLLHATSAIGKDLDSLADMVTFGVLPSFLLYALIEEGFTGTDYSFLRYAAFSIALFSALRLAKFNNDPRQSDRFIGLPTPASTLFVASLPHLDAGSLAEQYLLGNPWILVGITILLSYLLISEVPLLALKFKGFGWRENQRRYLVLITSLCFLLFLGWNAVPLILVGYLGVSFFEKPEPRAV
jgi:CDP-diacylglycerol--serine O-phosphatidyltransferase